MNTTIIIRISLIISFLFYQHDFFSQVQPVFAADGFAGSAGTTGGGNANPIIVNSTSELRSAVSGNNSKVVVVNGRFNLGGSISIGSNTTLIGANTSSGLYGGTVQVRGSNYIIQNLSFGPASGDVMEISGATNVYITKSEFHDSTDELCSIVRQADYVTISWSKFYFDNPDSHSFAHLIGNGDGVTADRGRLHTTLHHNWYDNGVRGRQPRVRFGEVHLYNNYFNSNNTDYCIGVGVEAKIRVENCHFDNVDDPWADYGGSGNGQMGWSGLLFENSSQPGFMSNSYPVFNLPYAFSPDPVNTVENLVRSCAGNVTTNCTTTPPPPPPPSGNESLALEAECGVVGGLFNQVSESNASGDTYVTVQSGNNSTDTPPDSNGQIAYSFNVSEAGTYSLWSRVITPNGTDDSFWVQMDGGEWLQWNNIGPTTSWSWQQASTYSLSSGAHTLIIGYREDGALLDKIYLSNKGDIPSGEGQTATNCGSGPMLYTLSTSSSPSNGGTISLNPSGGTYEDGTIVTVTANSASGYQFNNWSGASSSSSSSIQITMDGDKNLTANFSEETGGNTQTVTIQENETGFCDVEGSIDSNNSGYTGSGFSNTDNSNGNGVEWAITGAAGTYTFTWRYANEGATNRSAILYVNGNQQGTVDFNSTGSWTSWSTSSVTVSNLAANVKTIRLEANQDDGLANIDYLEATGQDATSASCDGTVNNTVTVNARGTAGSEVLELEVNGSVAATWTMSTAYQLYTYTGSASGQLRLNFINDAEGRDVQVDYLAASGTTYQAEDQSVNTSVWQNDSCGGANSEWMHCGGYIEFNTNQGKTAGPQLETSVTTYPNPVTTVLTIDLDSDTIEGVSILVLNSIGQEVRRVEVKDFSERIDMSGLKRGMYFLKVSGPNVNYTKKIIK